MQIMGLLPFSTPKNNGLGKIHDLSLVRQRHDPFTAELDRVAVVLEAETADAGVVAHLGIVVDFDALVKDRHPRLATQHVLGLTAPQLAVPRVVAT